MTASQADRPVTRADGQNSDRTVSELMRTDFRSCNATTPIAEVATALHQSGCTFLAVTRAQVPIGIVTEGDLAAALARHGGDLSRLTARDVMAADPPTIPTKAPLQQIISQFATAGGHLLAVDSDGLLKGVVTLAELRPKLSVTALGQLVTEINAETRLSGPPSRGDVQADAATRPTTAQVTRALDATSEIKSSKSQTQPHPWDPPTHAHPEPVPLVSPSDLVNPMLTVSDAMRPNPRTCSPASSVLEAAMVLRDEASRFVPVTESGRPVGVLTDRDIALALTNHETDLASTHVEALMSREVVTIRADALLDDGVKLLCEHRLDHLLVVDNEDQLIGVLSWTDLIAHLSERGLGGTVSRIFRGH